MYVSTLFIFASLVHFRGIIFYMMIHLNIGLGMRLGGSNYATFGKYTFSPKGSTPPSP
jgi:hypothetical protein